MFVGALYGMFGSSTREIIAVYISLIIYCLIIEFVGKINQSNTFRIIVSIVIKTKTFALRRNKNDRFLRINKK